MGQRQVEQVLVVAGISQSQSQARENGRELGWFGITVLGKGHSVIKNYRQKHSKQRVAATFGLRLKVSETTRDKIYHMTKVNHPLLIFNRFYILPHRVLYTDLIAVPFTIVRNGTNFDVLQKMMGKENLVHIRMEHHSSVKENKVMKFSNKWTELEYIVVTVVT